MHSVLRHHDRMHKYRSALVGVLLGVLLLVGVAGFAVALPEVTGDETAAKKPEQVPAADLLAPALVSGSLRPMSEAIPDLAALTVENERQTTARLTELFDADAAFQVYSIPSLQKLVSLTILDRAPGLFQPDGPPEPPAEGDKAGTNEMVRYGDVVCAISWGAEIAPTTKAPAAALPVKVQCQKGYDDRTFEIFSKGLTAAQTAAALNEAVAYAASVVEKD